MDTLHTLQAPEITIVFHPNTPIELRPIVKQSRDAVDVFRQHWDAHLLQLREEAKLMLLGRTGRVLGIFPLAAGGFNSATVDPALIFLVAVSTPGAEGIILAHNHPSGEPKPSQQDLVLTEKIKAGAALIGKKLADHLLITANGYLSFADQGIL
jgi:DNA repair protein RadC